MSTVAARIAKLIAIAFGWLVVVATSQRFDPVEHTDLEVDLAIGPEAPSTAVVDVTFEGAFIGQSNAVCGFARPESGTSESGITVDIGTLQRLGETTVEGMGGSLQRAWQPLTWAGVEGCVLITCHEEPCGGRFSIALVDEASPDAGVDPARFDPIPMLLVAMTEAEPGALPGRASITLVETRP